jgi:hypothetical protein
VLIVILEIYSGQNRGIMKKYSVLKGPTKLEDQTSCEELTQYTIQYTIYKAPFKVSMLKAPDYLLPKEINY